MRFFVAIQRLKAFVVRFPALIRLIRLTIEVSNREYVDPYYAIAVALQSLQLRALVQCIEC